MSKITQFKIESQSEADEYLKSLFEHAEYRTMNEVHIRAKNLIDDENLKIYFINKASEFLKNRS